MDFTGNLKGIQTDWASGETIISFTVNEKSALAEVDNLKDCKLSIKATKHRKKRSLDANAYCWVIMTKIADVVGSSKEEIYEEMLQKYGYFYEDEEGYIVMTVKKEVDMNKISGHWKFYKSNGKFSSYLMIKGSSEYDTAEMARFIDRIVEEAKELDIETLPPDELERMKSLWGAK